MGARLAFREKRAGRFALPSQIVVRSDGELLAPFVGCSILEPGVAASHPKNHIDDIKRHNRSAEAEDRNVSITEEYKCNDHDKSNQHSENIHIFLRGREERSKNDKEIESISHFTPHNKIKENGAFITDRMSEEFDREPTFVRKIRNVLNCSQHAAEDRKNEIELSPPARLQEKCREWNPDWPCELREKHIGQRVSLDQIGIA